MYKIVSSGRDHDVKQVRVCPSLIAVAGIMTLSRLVYVQAC